MTSTRLASSTSVRLSTIAFTLRRPQTLLLALSTLLSHSSNCHSYSSQSLLSHSQRFRCQQLVLFLPPTVLHPMGKGAGKGGSPHHGGHHGHHGGGWGGGGWGGGGGGWGGHHGSFQSAQHSSPSFVHVLNRSFSQSFNRLLFSAVSHSNDCAQSRRRIRSRSGMGRRQFHVRRHRHTHTHTQRLHSYVTSWSTINQTQTLTTSSKPCVWCAFAQAPTWHESRWFWWRIRCPTGDL